MHRADERGNSEPRAARGPSPPEVAAGTHLHGEGASRQAMRPEGSPSLLTTSAALRMRLPPELHRAPAYRAALPNHRHHSHGICEPIQGTLPQYAPQSLRCALRVVALQYQE
eukprot:2149242-Pyramimonas_sp.AAC.1